MLKMFQWANWNYGPPYNQALIPALGTRLPSYPTRAATQFNLGDCGLAASLGCNGDRKCARCAMGDSEPDVPWIAAAALAAAVMLLIASQEDVD